MAKFVCQVKALIMQGRWHLDFSELGDAKIYIGPTPNPYGDYRAVEVFAVINGARLELGVYIEYDKQWTALGSGEIPSQISPSTREEVLKRLGSWA